MNAIEMIAAHPHVRGHTDNRLIAAVDASADCAITCTVCADACLGEPMVHQLTQCIRLNLDCADVCAATARLAARRTGSDEETTRRMLETCIFACRICAEECERHAEHHEHCRLCAQSCRRCEQACKEALQSMH